jgi:hypothetical protein
VWEVFPFQVMLLAWKRGSGLGALDWGNSVQLEFLPVSSAEQDSANTYHKDQGASSLDFAGHVAPVTARGT